MSSPPSRILQVNRPIFEAPEVVRRPLVPRTRAEFPRVAGAHLDVAKRLTNPLLLGPPLCDELVAFVEHLYTEEEARLVRHLGALGGRTAEVVARREARHAADVEAILDRLAFDLGSIAAAGAPPRRRYLLTPIMPGIFEMVLIRRPPETHTDWHRRFAELFEALFQTGYISDYGGGSKPLVRYLPVAGAVDVHPMAMPFDKLESMLDRYQDFGVGPCQCRMTMKIVGHGCDKPIHNCAVMGEWARHGIEQGWARRVSKEEMLDIKREAEAHGLINWSMNVAHSKGQCSCSCCGCCCHALRSVTEHSAPGMIAPPHFVPVLEAEKCTHCGRCQKACPMGALAVDAKGKTWHWRAERCVGCGLCKVACERQQAIRMEAVPQPQGPYSGWLSLLVQSAPAAAQTFWRRWRKYK